MTKQLFQKTFSEEPLTKVVVENHMAPLLVSASEDNKVSLEGLLYLEEPEENFDYFDFMTAEYSDGVLKLTLDEVENMGNRETRSSQIKLTVPEGVFFELETDNYPMSLVGLNNNLKISSENAPVSISNCEGDKHIESENGPVRLHNCQGNLFAKLENGPLSAEAITGEGLKLESENGSLKVRLARFAKVDLNTENGAIYYETQPVEKGDFKFVTENGIVSLVLPIDFDFELTAKTESGHVKSRLEVPLNYADETYTLVNGNGDTKINIETENGVIKISNDGHLNLGFVKEKLEQLKEALAKANTSEEKEKVMELMNKVIEYLNRAVSSISEDKLKDKVGAAIIKLKTFGDKFDFDETREKVIVNLEEIGTQIQDGLKEGIKGVKSGFEEMKHKHLHPDYLQEYIRKVIDSPLIKPYLGGELKAKEKEDIADKSRLKILDMLESGKITSEEAEKLLKAIGKE
ncbi:hypothetical protein MASR1M36_04490 [Candidatus Cloacimonadaceae bacterium]